mgnify:CR=1 FL=1|tara:strand:- start:3372 stop:3551 length:180 start_codon:yes stop_codon:yes gene_type:complete
MEDLTNKLTAYESGQLTDEESVELFQYLIDSGMVWKLQGHYGRMSEYLIESGLCKAKTS